MSQNEFAEDFTIALADEFPSEEGRDELLLDRITFLAKAMEIDKAHDFMVKKFLELRESTIKHAFSIDGAWAQEASEMAKAYGWAIKWEQTGFGKLSARIFKEGSSVEVITEEGNRLQEAIKKAQDKYILIKGLREDGKRFDTEYNTALDVITDSSDDTPEE